MLVFIPDSDEVPADTIFINTNPAFNFLTMNFHRKEFPAVHHILLNERPLLVSATFENFGGIGSFPALNTFLACKFEPVGEQEP